MNNEEKTDFDDEDDGDMDEFEHGWDNQTWYCYYYYDYCNEVAGLRKVEFG